MKERDLESFSYLANGRHSIIDTCLTIFFIFLFSRLSIIFIKRRVSNRRVSKFYYCIVGYNNHRAAVFEWNFGSPRWRMVENSERGMYLVFDSSHDDYPYPFQWNEHNYDSNTSIECSMFQRSLLLSNV